MIFYGFIKNLFYDPVSSIGIITFYFLLINLPISLLALFNKKSSSYVRLITIFITPITPKLSSDISEFFGEASYDSFDCINLDVKKINNYKHLLRRLEQDSINSMISEDKK